MKTHGGSAAYGLNISKPVVVKVKSSQVDLSAATSGSLKKPKVGQRVIVVPGQEHHGVGGAGVIRSIGTPALGIEFDDNPGEIHKWYTAAELNAEKADAPLKVSL